MSQPVDLPVGAAATRKSVEYITDADENFTFLDDLNDLKELLVRKTVMKYSRKVDKIFSRMLDKKVQLTELQQEEVNVIKTEHLDDFTEQISEIFDGILATDDMQNCLNQIYDIEKNLPDTDTLDITKALYPIRKKYYLEIKEIKDEVVLNLEPVTTEKNELEKEAAKQRKHIITLKKETNKVTVALN